MDAEALVQVDPLRFVAVASGASFLEAVLQSLRTPVVPNREDSLVLGNHTSNAA